MKTSVIKLNQSHADAIRPLFKVPKFMGVSHDHNYFVGKELPFDEVYHAAFCGTYLSDLKNYHAYATINIDGNITALIAFYESIDDASWYWSHVRTLGQHGKEIKMILDEIMKYNESNGRLKFYSMFPKKYAGIYRRLAFSTEAKTRYDYFDEFYIPERHQCMFTLPWQILYTRTLLPVETIVRCTFLKQKYRIKPFNAGRL